MDSMLYYCPECDKWVKREQEWPLTLLMEILTGLNDKDYQRGIQRKHRDDENVPERDDGHVLSLVTTYIRNNSRSSIELELRWTAYLRYFEREYSTDVGDKKVVYVHEVFHRYLHEETKTELESEHPEVLTVRVIDEALSTIPYWFGRLAMEIKAKRSSETIGISGK